MRRIRHELLLGLHVDEDLKQLGQRVVAVADRAVPFNLLNIVGADLADYRPAATLAGSIAAWLMVGATLAFARRRTLGPTVWRIAHRVAFGAWALALVHGVSAGSDSGSDAAQWFYLFTAVPLVGAMVYRVLLARLPAAVRLQPVPR